jgi:hypothetical protein
VIEIARSTGELERTVPIEPEGTFFVGLDRGSVEIASHEANEIRIVARATGPAASLADFTLSRSGNEVSLDLSLGSRLATALAPVKIRVVATVPRRCAVDVETRSSRVELREIGGNCSARTSGARVEVTRLDGHALLRTSGGAIVVDDVTGDVDAKTSGGKIRCERVDGDCELKTSGGAVVALDVLGRVDATTSGGKIHVQFSDEPGGRLKTSGGSILAEYPEGCGVDLDAHTSGGGIKLAPEIDVDGKQKKRHVRAHLDGGGDDLELHTSGGSIHIKTWEPPVEEASPRPSARAL